MSDNNATKAGGGGIGVLGVLGCIFVTLKLTGNIDWSWWWVTVPFWGGFALLLAILLVCLLILGLCQLTLLALTFWESRAKK